MSIPSGFNVGQIGAKIRLDTADDPDLLAAATVKQIMYRQPTTGKKGVWEATLEGTKLCYTTTSSSDLPIAGDWEVRTHLSGSGWELQGNIAIMQVGEAF